MYGFDKKYNKDRKYNNCKKTNKIYCLYGDKYISNLSNFQHRLSEIHITGLK